MAKYRITDPQTGKTVTVSGNKPPTQAQAEDIFSTAGLRQEKQEGLVQKGSDVMRSFGLGILPNIAANLYDTKTFVTDKEKGQQVAQAEAEGVQGYDNPFRTEQQLEKQWGEGNKSGAKQWAKDSVGIASWGIPFGKGTSLATKALLPGAGVGAGQRISQDDATMTNVAGSALFGAGTAGVLNKVAPLFSKGASRLGAIENPVVNMLEKGAKVATNKATKFSNSQRNKFRDKTGQELEEFLASREKLGISPNDSARIKTEMQQVFDDVIDNEGLMIKPETLKKAFKEEIKRLYGNEFKPDDSIAKQLEYTLDKLFKSTFKNNKPIDARSLTNKRIEMDARVSENQFADETIKSPYRLMRDIYQNAIRNEADDAGIQIGGKTFKEYGRELSKWYTLDDIIQTQAGKGKSNNPLSLTKLLALIAGGQVFSLPGMVAGAGAVMVANSPRTARGVARGLSGAANAIKSGNVPTGSVPSELQNLLMQGTNQIAPRVPSGFAPKKSQPKKQSFYNNPQYNALRRVQNKTKEFNQAVV